MVLSSFTKKENWEEEEDDEKKKTMRDNIKNDKVNEKVMRKKEDLVILSYIEK